MRADVIINPVSGRHGDGDREVRRRRDAIARAAHAAGVEVQVHVTAHAGHATSLARAAAEGGSRVVVAWGGDGTVNEVATGLAFGATALAIVPAGSGNGLARELGVPWAPERALATAFGGRTRQIDLGQINDRLFVNVAGIGFDACVARSFNAHRSGGWGLPKYVWLALRDARHYEPQRYRISTGEASLETNAYVIAVANSAQYGNGASIAPAARVDDGLLDMVIVEVAPVWRMVIESRRMFDGSMARARGVQARRLTDGIVACDTPMAMHVDGEPVAPVTEARIRIHRAALRVVGPA